MAIGLGRIIGFNYKENFNYPYISSSITEFWRRWHMSLSGFFRKYVYIPLGGNRKGGRRTRITSYNVCYTKLLRNLKSTAFSFLAGYCYCAAHQLDQFLCDNQPQPCAAVFPCCGCIRLRERDKQLALLLVIHAYSGVAYSYFKPAGLVAAVVIFYFS